MVTHPLCMTLMPVYVIGVPGIKVCLACRKLKRRGLTSRGVLRMAASEYPLQGEPGWRHWRLLSLRIYGQYFGRRRSNTCMLH